MARPSSRTIWLHAAMSDSRQPAQPAQSAQSEQPVVLVEARDGVQIITINRPHARNALNGAVARAIADAVDELDADDDLKVGVLTGAGGTFCSGMDLKGFLTGDLPLVEGRGLGGITERAPRKPLIGAVEGYAVAGGFELLLACDLVVASETARLGVPEVKRGLVAGAGAAMLLPQRIPPAIALEMLLTGDPITAARAAELGLVNRVVPEGTALDGALTLAAAIAANGPLAVATTKRVALESPGWSFEDRWHKQGEMMMPVFGSADAAEGATAFAEKRPPRWTGR
jgi:enoyl-CoA hydratase